MKKIREILNWVGLLTALLYSIAEQALSQDLKSEKDLQKQAETLFKDQEYINAFPLFSQLLSLYPDNINYNYKFSVCMLFADKDKGKAIPYLVKVTSDMNTDKKSYFYLGMAYHLNYEFDKAIQYYEKYKKNALKKDADALQIDRRMEMCKNGLKLLRNKTDLSVLNKTEIKESEYFRAYDMDLLGGKILVKPDDFKSESDKEKGENSLVYLGENASVIFYSSLGKKDTNKDIYKVTKKSDGSWGSPEILPGIINSDYDEDFPVMHPNSKVLYFCSKGHNSMGGYDIFKSTYDSINDTWNKPVNLNFAINSADDDLLYLPTEDELTAYFSSNRSSVQGMITVYKVKLKEVPASIPQIASEKPEAEGELETVEPLALEEIKKTAELEVNATESDLNTTGKAIETPEEPQPSSAMMAETFINLSDQELVDVAKEYAQKIKNTETKIKNEAEASFALAGEKKEQADVKAAEAQAIRYRIDNITDNNQKETAVQKAANLEADAEKLSKESEITFQVAKSLASEADNKQKESQIAAENAIKIEAAVKNNQKDESISLLIEQKVLVQTSTETNGVNQLVMDKEQEAKTFEAKAGDAYEKIQIMENEIAEINDDIQRLNAQAEETKDPTIKEEIINQSRELDGEMKGTEKELAATYQEAKKLETESKSKRNEANVIAGVSNEIISNVKQVELASATSSSKLPTQKIKEKEEKKTKEAEPQEIIEKEPLVSIEPAEKTKEPEKTQEKVAAETEPIALTSDETGKTGEQPEYDINPVSVEQAQIEEQKATIPKLEQEAKNYNKEAADIREKASAVKDPSFKENAIKEAEKLEQAANKKQAQVSESKAVINSFNYRQNETQLKTISSGSEFINPDELRAIKEKEEAYIELFDSAQILRTNAKSRTDPQEQLSQIKKADELEKNAIARQEEAIHTAIFLENKGKLSQMDEEPVNIETGESARLNDLKSKADNLFDEAGSVREKAGSIIDSDEKSDALNTASLLENQAIIKQQEALAIYVSAEEKPLASVQKTPLPAEQELVAIASNKEAKEKEAAEEPEKAITPPKKEVMEEETRPPEELTAVSEQQKREAEKLYESIETIEDPDLMMATLEKAEKLEKEADINQAKANRIKASAETEKNTGERITTPEAVTTPSKPETVPVTSYTLQDKPIETASPEDLIDAILNDKVTESTTYQPAKTETIMGKTSATTTTSATTSTETAISSNELEAAQGQTSPMRVIYSGEPIKENVFSIQPAVVYSASNPIPVDPVIPSGLVFKVQIGAFKNPIPQDLFKGISPITGERTNMGFIRYSAGLFTNIESANEAKATIRNFGYSDAFVVAFYDGERITIKQARAALASGGPPAGISSGSTPLVTSTAGVNTAASSESVPGTIDLNTVPGLIYTVQIGVYSKPSNIGQVYGLSPLYTLRTSATGGLIKYSYSIYNSFNEANATKQDVVQKGIKDAFVTAYLDGKRISVSQAQGINAADKGAVPIETETKTPSTPTLVEKPVGEATYMVQIGEYEKDVPVDEATLFFRIKDMGLNRRQKDDKIVYTVGEFGKYEEAEELRKTVEGKGLKDAYVIVKLNGELIAVEDYLKSNLEGAGVPKTPNEENTGDEGAFKKKVIDKMPESEAKTLVREIQNIYDNAASAEANARKLHENAQKFCDSLLPELSTKEKDGLLTQTSALMKDALSAYETAKKEVEKAQKMEDVSKFKMAAGAYSDEEIAAFFSALVPAVIDPVIVNTIPESELDNLKNEVKANYDDADTLQSYVRAKVEEDRAVLYKLREIDEETMITFDETLWKVELVKASYVNADYELFHARCKMILASFTKEKTDEYLVAGSVYDENILPQILPAETDKLLGQTRSAYDVATEIENAAQVKIDDAKQRIISAEKIEYPSERENEIQKAKQLKVEGILEMETVTSAQNSARNRFLINSYKLLFGRIKREDADFQRLEYITQ